MDFNHGLGRVGAGDAMGAALIAGGALLEQIKAPRILYRMSCFDKDGRLKWEEDFENVVTSQGKAVLLDVMFGTAGSTTQITSWYCGLISSVSYTTGPQATDTAAQINGTNAWKEAAGSFAPNYSAGTRASLVWAAASGAGPVNKATSAAASFAISGAGTVKGCFVSSSSTKDGTAGVLYSAGTFSGGDKVVGGGDTLNVTGTLSVA